MYMTLTIAPLNPKICRLSQLSTVLYQKPEPVITQWKCMYHYQEAFKP